LTRFADTEHNDFSAGFRCIEQHLYCLIKSRIQPVFQPLELVDLDLQNALSLLKGRHFR
jgi:hypothetical protein